MSKAYLLFDQINDDGIGVSFVWRYFTYYHHTNKKLRYHSMCVDYIFNCSVDGCLFWLVAWSRYFWVDTYSVTNLLCWTTLWDHCHTYFIECYKTYYLCRCYKIPLLLVTAWRRRVTEAVQLVTRRYVLTTASVACYWMPHLPHQMYHQKLYFQPLQSVPRPAWCQ